MVRPSSAVQNGQVLPAGRSRASRPKRARASAWGRKRVIRGTPRKAGSVRVFRRVRWGRVPARGHYRRGGAYEATGNGGNVWLLNIRPAVSLRVLDAAT